MISINQDNFEAEVLRSQVPALVDFFAYYCGPCRLLKPVLAALAESLGSRARIATVDVVANEGLAQAYQIAAVPTLIVFKSGVEIHRLVGLKDIHQLQEALGV